VEVLRQSAGVYSVGDVIPNICEGLLE